MTRIQARVSIRMAWRWSWPRAVGFVLPVNAPEIFSRGAAGVFDEGSGGGEPAQAGYARVVR